MVEPNEQEQQALAAVGEDVGESTMIVHAGGHSASFAEVCEVPLPDKTDTYSVVSHASFVNCVYASGERILSPEGWKIAGQRFALANQGRRMFFIQTWKSERDPELGLAFAGRNSYDKSLSVAIAIGASVFVCDNTCIHGSGVTLFRRHSGDAHEYLTKEIRNAMFDAAEPWTKLVDDRNRWADIPVSRTQGYALMGLAKAFTSNEPAPERLLDAPTEWENVEQYWRTLENADAPHTYQGGPRTLWAWYNSFTVNWRSISPTVAMQRHSRLHELCDTFVTDEYLKDIIP